MTEGETSWARIFGHIKDRTGAQDWQRKAGCRGKDQNLWFPEKYDGNNGFEAKDICWNECDVREECLEYAVSNVERIGIWGGYGQKELRRMRAARDLERKATG